MSVLAAASMISSAGCCNVRCAPVLRWPPMRSFSCRLARAAPSYRISIGMRDDDEPLLLDWSLDVACGRSVDDGCRGSGSRSIRCRLPMWGIDRERDSIAQCFITTWNYIQPPRVLYRICVYNYTYMVRISYLSINHNGQRSTEANKAVSRYSNKSLSLSLPHDRVQTPRSDSPEIPAVLR